MIGSQTVTFVSESDGELDRKNIPAQVPTSTQVCGCLLMPLGMKEEVSNIAFAVNHYALYAEPYPAVLAAKPDDLVVDASGAEYHVIGTNIFPSLNGTINHVKVLLWQPSGLNAPPSDAY